MSFFPKKFAAIVGFHTLYNTIHEEGIMYPRYILSDFKNENENLFNGINHNTIIFLTADNLDKDKLVGARNYKINAGDRFIITHKDVFSLFDGRAVAGPTGEQGPIGATGPQGEEGIGIFPLNSSQKDFLTERFARLISPEDPANVYLENNNIVDFLNSILTRYIINQEFSIEVIEAIKQCLQEFKTEYPNIRGSIIIGTYLYICDTDLLINEGVLDFIQYFDMKGETGETGENGKDGLGIYPLSYDLAVSLLELLSNNGLSFEGLATPVLTLNKILNDFVDRNLLDRDFEIVLSTLQDFKQQYSINGSILVGDYLYQVNVEALQNGTWTFSSYLLLKGEKGKDGIGVYPLNSSMKSALNTLFKQSGVFNPGNIYVEDPYTQDDKIITDNINVVLTRYLDKSITDELSYEISVDLLDVVNNNKLYGSLVIGDYFYSINTDLLEKENIWELTGYENLKGDPGYPGENGKTGVGIYSLSYTQKESLNTSFNEFGIYDVIEVQNRIPDNEEELEKNINTILIKYLNELRYSQADDTISIVFGIEQSLINLYNEYNINDSLIIGDYLYLLNVEKYREGTIKLQNYIYIKGENGRGITPLSLEQQNEFVQYLLDNGADFITQDFPGYEPFYIPDDPTTTLNRVFNELIYINNHHDEEVIWSHYQIINLDNAINKYASEKHIDGMMLIGDYLYINDYNSETYILVEYKNLKGDVGPVGPTGPTGPIGKGIYVLDDNQKSELYDLIFNVYGYGLKDDSLIDVLIKTVKTFNGEDLISPSNVAAVLSALDDFISKNDINGSIIIDNYLFYIDSEGTPRDYTDLKGEKGDKGTGPIGSVMLWAGNEDVEIPEGWLECNGNSIPTTAETVPLEDGAIPPGYTYDCYVISEVMNEAILYSARESEYSNLLKVIGTKYGAGMIEEGYGEVRLPDITGISTSDGEAILKYIICYK